jgi:1,4-dihydroxy-2-naphthoate octaprenyltransferase
MLTARRLYKIIDSSVSLALGKDLTKYLSGLALWLAAVRPKTLSLSVSPVLVGSVMAWSEGAYPQPGIFVVALVSALFIQSGTNLLNDAEDAIRGNDPAERTGPVRVTAAGLVSPRKVKSAAYMAFFAAFLGGVYLSVSGGWVVIAAGIASLFAGWAYSSGARPLSHTAFGEILVIAFFGLIALTVSYYLQGGERPFRAMVAGLAFGFPAAAVLLLNNIRDLEDDLRAGRRTLASRLGPRVARYLYAALVLSPFVLLAAAYGAHMLGITWLAIVPSAWLAWRFIGMPEGAAMNRQLANTALVQLLLAALFCSALLMN